MREYAGVREAINNRTDLAVFQSYEYPDAYNDVNMVTLDGKRAEYKRLMNRKVFQDIREEHDPFDMDGDQPDFDDDDHDFDDDFGNDIIEEDDEPEFIAADGREFVIILEDNEIV
jgi:hypothetical protein